MQAPALAQEAVKIGILNDQSGPFASYQGIGSDVAAKMAVEDYGGRAGGKPVEIVAADHQNKTDIGIGIARRWYENEGVDAIFDVPNSSIALAVAGMSAEKDKVFVGSGAGTALLTGEKCTPNTVHWTYDTYAYGRGLGKAIVQQGGKKWFFITETTPSVMILRNRLPRPSMLRAVKCWAPSVTHSERQTTPRFCCRPRHPAPISLALPMPATTRSIL